MIFATIAALLMKLGLGKQTANRAAPFAFALAVLIAAGGAFALWLHFHDSGVVARHVTGANNKTLTTTITANETAAAEQLADQQALDDMQRSFEDALKNPPAGSSKSTRVRHACQQLRNDGYREADLPEDCGHAGTDGGKTTGHP